MELGTTSINVISDGTFLLDGGSVFGQVPKSTWEQHVKPDRRNRVRLALNCLLIRTPEHNILVDTGAGSKRAEKLKDLYSLNGNKLLKGLREVGLTARDIDMVILSHLTFEHAGGCTKLDRSGNAVPTFPKARYLVQQTCWEEANSPNERVAPHIYTDDFLPLYDKGVVDLIDAEHEVIPGITVKATSGPSTGHQIVMIQRGGERVVYASDLIPTPYHLPLPYIPAIDEHPNETLVQKRELLEMIMGGGWVVAFGHGNDHRAGYVEERHGRPQLLPVVI